MLYVICSLFTVLTHKLSLGTNKLPHHCHLLLLCLRKICHKGIKIIPALFEGIHTFPKLPSFLFFPFFQVSRTSFPCVFFCRFSLPSSLTPLHLPLVFQTDHLKLRCWPMKNFQGFSLRVWGHQMFAKYSKNFTSTSKNIFSKKL